MNIVPHPSEEDAKQLFELAMPLIQRPQQGARQILEQLLLSSVTQELLAPLFLLIIDAGLYEPCRQLLCSGGTRDSVVLRALAEARPRYGCDDFNAAALAELAKQGPTPSEFPYGLIIVPGYTPLEASEPVHLRDIPAMQKRIELAAQDYLSGKAPFVFLTGGNVHPAGTIYNEALMMREYLMDQGISPSRIIVDPHARHTTTNVRNAGRLMVQHGIEAGIIVTGFESPIFSQVFYLSEPDLSTFNLRYHDTLGHSPGELAGLDLNHVEFRPSPECMEKSYFDPLDV